MTNTPGYCCSVSDNAKLHIFDNRSFNYDPVVGGYCSPFPYICTHFCGLCGEVLVLRGGIAGSPPPGGHCPFAVCGMFCPISCICGLEHDEGDSVATVINDKLKRFQVEKGEGDFADTQENDDVD